MAQLPQWATASSLSRLHDHTELGTLTLSWTPLDGGISATTHNTNKIRTSLPPAGFEPTIPANGRQRINALYHVASEIGSFKARIGEIHICVLGMISHALQGKNLGWCRMPEIEAFLFRHFTLILYGVLFCKV